MVKLLVLGGLLVAGTLFWDAGPDHGHAWELLEVTVGVADRDTGEPVEGAVVAVVRFRSQFERESFESEFEDSVERAGDVDDWRRRICAVRTADHAETTIRTSLCVTRRWIGRVEIGKDTDLPQALLIDLPRCGRKIVRIDPNTPVRRGPRIDTWRLDLGTVRVVTQAR